MPVNLHGLPRHRQAALDFGTDRYPIHVFAQGVGQEMVELVSAVVTDLFTEKAGAYTEFDLFHEGDPFITETLTRALPIMKHNWSGVLRPKPLK